MADTIDYKDFAEKYVTAMEEKDIVTLQDLPNKLTSTEENLAAFKAIKELFDSKPEEFKKDYEVLIAGIEVAIELNGVDTADTTEAASEVATDGSEEAVEPDAGNGEQAKQ